MIKKLTTIVIIIFIFFLFYLITSKNPDSSTTTIDSNLVLFYGDTCPHCEDVEEFISQNQIDQKLKINRLEVYNSKENSNTMVKMVNENCKDQLNPQGLPVPFLINTDDKACFIGTPDITNHLTEKAN
ncbi:MAG: hypothetical protein WCX20_03050 [Candidatus Shapirobacteria bacterium]